jgi:CRP/FNR family transcriptional regulator
MKGNLKEYYATLFEEALIEEIEDVAVYRKLEAGELLMDIGKTVRSMPLLLSGAIKVMREDENGDELLLYYLEKGDTCAMTMSCCMGNSRSEIRAVAEVETEVLLVPVHKIEEWVGKYKGWRKFVFDSFNTRTKELLEAIDKLAFLKMDERLLEYLREKAKISDDNCIRNTHQEIAFDLHTSRVVISRLLKRLEKEGLIELFRNRIRVVSL